MAVVFDMDQQVKGINPADEAQMRATLTRWRKEIERMDALPRTA